MITLVTTERLNELLYYNHETGLWRWKVSKVSIYVGAVAGSRHPNGYILIGIDGFYYRAHHLAWFYMTGEWPPVRGLDHKDLDRANNSWSNLRRATVSQNMGNRRKRSDNTSGYKGVYFVPKKGKWRVQVQGRHVGYFAEIEDARDAYRASAISAYGEFARAE